MSFQLGTVSYESPSREDSATMLTLREKKGNIDIEQGENIFTVSGKTLGVSFMNYLELFYYSVELVFNWTFLVLIYDYILFFLMWLCEYIIENHFLAQKCII